MALRLAFVGFRHGHIWDLYKRAQEMPEIEIVAACEEDPVTRADLIAQGRVEITHRSLDDLLDGVPCDAIAIGDYYSKRGCLAIRALSAGKHIISDKPICTALDELDQIESIAGKRGLTVGCMLDMRDGAPCRGARELIGGGTIGEVHAVAFGGQHPLLRDTRAAWYFQPGRHGGTINDIAIHAMDGIPWITGLRWHTVEAARCWNATARDVPHFQNAAQMMLTMDNGAGVLGDVSYLMPDSQGYTSPFYWRMTFWGERGVLEIAHNSRQALLVLNGESQPRTEPLPAGDPGGYLRAFLADIEGRSAEGQLTTEDVLSASRVALVAQQAADTGGHHIHIEGARNE